MSWHSFNTFILRVLLWGANVFLAIAFVFFFVNYFAINDVEYFKTISDYRIAFLVYLAVLIFLGGICCRRTKLPLNFYRAYLVLLVLAIILSTAYLIFVFQKMSVYDDFRNDMDNFQKGQNTTRLDYYQKNFKCCGTGGSNGGYYDNVPDSCLKATPSEDNSPDRQDVAFKVNHVIMLSDEKENDIHVLNEGSGSKYYEDSCLDSLSKTFKEQQGLNNKLLMTVVFSSLSASIIIYILMFVEEEDF